MYCLHCGAGPYKKPGHLENHILFKHGNKEYKIGSGYEFRRDWGFEEDVHKISNKEEKK